MKYADKFPNMGYIFENREVSSVEDLLPNVESADFLQSTGRSIMKLHFAVKIALQKWIGEPMMPLSTTLRTKIRGKIYKNTV